MKPKMCPTCSQPLPKRVPQERDIVELQPLCNFGKDVRLGVVLDTVLQRVMTDRYCTPMTGYVRVVVLNGPMAGLTTQWALDRLTVVKGHFHVKERL